VRLRRDAVDAGPQVHLSHAGHLVPHQQVIDRVHEGGYGWWRDPAGLAKVVSIPRGDIGLGGLVHRQPAGGVHDGGVRPPGYGVGNDVGLARDVVDGEPAPHGLQLVVEESGVVDGLQGLVSVEDGQEGVVVHAEDEIGEA
jgi:hypothetical protein